LAYDVGRQRVVLFGGWAGGSTRFADTWEWDGTSWIQQSPATSPSARSFHAMAYDFGRQRVVLFGGSGSNRLSDTWEWNGSNWTQSLPTTNPDARFSPAMAYDLGRQRVVLFGGFGSNGELADTWDWDGSNWTQRSPATSPSARYGHAMASDLARRRVVLFGGRDLDRVFADTWLFGPLTPAISEAFGTACAGSRGLPVLTTNSPYPGNPAFALDLLSARPASPCAFGLSGATQALTIGPCTLYLQDPILFLLAASNWSGFAEATRFAIPPDITLRGRTVYAQAFVADPQGPVLGVAFSAGLRLVLGE
jgi:hypothetical protein